MTNAVAGFHLQQLFYLPLSARNALNYELIIDFLPIQCYTIIVPRRINSKSILTISEYSTKSDFEYIIKFEKILMKLILQASVQSNVQVLPRWNFLLLFQDAQTAR